MDESDSNGAKLDELLQGSAGEIESWLSERGLVHECDCGYTVYDPWDVNAAVQEEWGDKRCDEIHDWACNLSNQFGWLFLESSNPECDIYHCQHCADSEWSLFLDMERMADKAKEQRQTERDTADGEDTAEGSPTEHLLVYVDESYEGEFPRKPGGCYAYAAVVVPESAAAGLSDRLKAILKDCYRGRLPKELKHKKVKESDRLLDCIGPKVVDLVKKISGSAVLGLFVPRDGYFGEKTRGIRAAAYYQGKEPPAKELAEVTAEPAVEQAVAIVAPVGFDVTQIDPASVTLEGIPPLKWHFEDVATPFEPFTGKEDCEDCAETEPDGELDLLLHFSNQELAAVLSGAERGDCYVLTIEGNLLEEFGGTPIRGEDVVTVRQ